jgi:hypothetical protein
MEDIGHWDIEPLRPSFSVVEVVQNPALGAAAVWSAASGHYIEDERPLPFHLAFLVLPIVLHRETRDIVSSTYESSGLVKFAFKYKGHEDNLLAVHTRSLMLRTLTLDSISTALAAQLLSLDYANAALTPAKVRGRPRQARDTEEILDAATKVGRWFAQLPLWQICSMLRVEL